MEAALSGQDGGRRMHDEGIAWFVELNPLTGVLTLEIGRWTGTGRVVHRRFQGEPGCTTMAFEAFGERWVLYGDSFDVVPEGTPARQYTAEVAQALREQALKPIEFGHAPVMSEKAVARADIIRRANSHRTNARLTEAVFANWPSGYRMLPVAFGQAPKLYRVRRDMGTLLMPEVYVEVRKPKALIALGRMEGGNPAAWITSYHRVLGGLARIYGEDYTIAPDGTTVYRPGSPEDCWSFPELSQEAALRFEELRPPNSVQLPGCLAWYMVAATLKVVRVTWYNARRDAVNDFLLVDQGFVEWHSKRFMLLPTGELVLV